MKKIIAFAICCGLIMACGKKASDASEQQTAQDSVVINAENFTDNRPIDVNQPLFLWKDADWKYGYIDTTGYEVFDVNGKRPNPLVRVWLPSRITRANGAASTRLARW